MKDALLSMVAQSGAKPLQTRSTDANEVCKGNVAIGSERTVSQARNQKAAKAAPFNKTYFYAAFKQ